MSHQQILHNFLAPMIAANSVSSDISSDDVSNLIICEYLANRLDQLGFTVTLYPVPSSNDKWNLIAHRPGNKQTSGGIMLSGHTDTVPALSNQWTTDPWQIHQQNNRFTGLGVTDMKGFFASLILALSDLPNNPVKPITVIATADEETSMAGARAIKSEWLNKPALNIIGEPTGLQPLLSHKGYLAYRVTLSSTGGHSSLNANQLNCIEAAQSVIQQLILLRSKLQKIASDEAFSVPVSTLNLGTLKAGDVINRICANAILEFDIRPLPNVNNQQLEAWVNQAVEQGLNAFDVTSQLSAIYPPVHGFASSLDHKLKDQLEGVCGCHSNSANFVTEAPWFEKLGVPSVILGPGEIDQAHQANETVSIDQLATAQRIYREMILKTCF